MVKFIHKRWLALVVTVLVWAALSASVCAWYYQISDLSTSNQSALVAEPSLVLDQQGLMRFLAVGSEAKIDQNSASQVTPSNYKLVGVLAGTRSKRGAALIAVDGNSAKLYRVGDRVEGDAELFLQSMQNRQVQLGQKQAGEVALVLELPEPFSNEAEN